MDSLITFTSGQLALLTVVLGSMVWFGFKRLLLSIDGRFDRLEQVIAEIQSTRPTRHEVDKQISGVHRRIDDMRGHGVGHPHRRNDDDTLPGVGSLT